MEIDILQCSGAQYFANPIRIYSQPMHRLHDFDRILQLNLAQWFIVFIYI